MLLYTSDLACYFWQKVIPFLFLSIFQANILLKILRVCIDSPNNKVLYLTMKCILKKMTVHLQDTGQFLVLLYAYNYWKLKCLLRNLFQCSLKFPSNFSMLASS